MTKLNWRAKSTATELHVSFSSTAPLFHKCQSPTSQNSRMLQEGACCKVIGTWSPYSLRTMLAQYIYIYKHCCFHHLAVFIVRVGVICDFLVLAAWRRGHWQGVLPKSGSASAAFCLTVSLSPPSQQRCLQSARTRVCSSRRSRSSPPKRHPGWVGDPQAAWCPWWWGLGRGAQARAVTVAIATVATAKSTNRAPPPDPRLLTINGNTSLRQEERNPSPSDVQSSTLDIFLSSSHFGWSPRNGCDSCICTLQTWRWNGGSCDFRCQKIKNTGGYRKAWTWLERVLQVSCNSSGCTVLIAIDSQFLVT